MSTNDDNLIGSLNDSCFEHASESLTTLCQMVEQETGVKPTLNDLCRLLSLSIQSCSGDLFSDVNPEALVELKPKVARRKKVTLGPGDIFAIPRKGGGFYFTVYIVSNQFGDSFGVFDGHSKVPLVTAAWQPIPKAYPVYTGRALIVGGRWKCIDHREDLLESFPSSPEIYHAKADNPSDDRIGGFGSAESADGEIRSLTESEVIENCWDSATYRQIQMEEEFEEYLHTLLG